MLMPVREYNKHIAKIPNCKMRQRPTLRATFAPLLLLLHIAQTLDPAAASGSVGSGAAAAGAAGPSAPGGAGGGSLSSGPPTLIANLTEQGSPANTQVAVMKPTSKSQVPNPPNPIGVMPGTVAQTFSCSVPFLAFFPRRWRYCCSLVWIGHWIWNGNGNGVEAEIIINPLILNFFQLK
ncbi:uncharacterized protein LOC122615194 [Drosophila teissieri]|uniref:uncharacterized protein LOC122615194 n=1 Tax=Drosophila teissieri TaxID=7243 RepID=UPI001CBA3BDC|nr:uncharacterized protein LOC122615194 [Drosophila teissieri]XP_043646073.1 uncharacterized protein LOC122615194 [Drosophila teissieri]